MSGRLAATFAALKASRRCGLVPYVTAGDPDVTRSREIVRALDRAGADALESGVPFSEPLADGPVIQRASERALAAGMSLAGALDLVAALRGDIRAPVVLFTYANPVFRMGLDRFVARAAEAGVDGVLTLDLPVEESSGLRGALAARGLDTIFLVSPTTTDARIEQAARLGSGFLYAISRLGVTGARTQVAHGVRELAARIRRATDLPLAVGFGLSQPEHVAAVAEFADAAVVGSALVDLIARSAEAPDLAARVEQFVRSLKGEAVQPAVGHG
jgi:tryptophan synthase alpha chain